MIGRRRLPWVVAVLLCVLPMATSAAEPTVRDTVEGIVARMRASLEQQQMLAADRETVERFVTPADRAVLGTRYWCFDANVPVVVSVMRHTGQATAPFWLQERGFTKTDLRVRNEEYEYEVWQKEFPAGRVGLGINGFELHRPHYFVSVGPQQRGAALRLSRFFPASQRQHVMRPGASTYHDWSSLVLTEVPELLRGQVLLPTIRGRAREAHLIGGFRATPYPSSDRPDLVALTWSEDPRTTQTVQWRCSSSAAAGAVRWRPAARSSAPWRTVRGTAVTLSDSRILNDPRVRWFTATMRGLRPGAAYTYAVGSPSGRWSAPATFRTAPQRPAPFTFVWLSDTHNRDSTAALLAQASRKYPDAAFCTVSGDLVGMGQYRDDWDQFFQHMGSFASRKPVAPAIGNHDTIDGLGAGLYRSLFGLPANGPRALQPERAYSFTYSDTLFLILDCTESTEVQKPWIEQQLRTTTARWKFVVFHFPPYSDPGEYADIVRDWCPLFDRHHVDFVLAGHVHELQRTYPLRAGRAVKRPADGTIYLVTVSVPQRPRMDPRPATTLLRSQPGPALFNTLTVDGKRLVMRVYDADGRVYDELKVTK